MRPGCSHAGQIDGFQMTSRPDNPVKSSVDAFYYGGFHVMQPLETGHRSGQDALFLAACLPSDASGKLADLGAGAGVAGLAAATLNPIMEVTLVELNPVMAGLARRSAGLEENRHLQGRIGVVEADVTLKGRERVAAGLVDNSFDHVLMNPPYNHSGQRKSPDLMKQQAHAISGEGIAAWLRTASAILKPGGNLVMIYRSETLPEVLSAASGRFGDIRLLPLHSRGGQAAKRVIILARAGSRGPMRILPGITVHDENGQFTEKVKAVFAGKGLLV